MKITEFIKLTSHKTELSVPYFASTIPAGNPSSTENYVEKTIDFNTHLIRNRHSTFCLRVHGDSMINAGIFDNDILIVDRSLTAQNDHIVIASLNGEFTVKRLIKTTTNIQLHPENPRYQPITITKEHDFKIWGVVTNVIHKL